MTAVVVHAVKRFQLDMKELHNDSTTITFTGQYQQANGHSHHGQPTHRITHGHNKDHRPDLKQLLYILTTTSDGSVPIWCNVEHGNTTDDQTHIATWNVLRAITGNSNFLYVADSKLCTKENMEHIAKQGGTFVTVLPQSRREDQWFREWLQTNQASWTELIRRPNSRRKDDPDDVYKGFQSPQRSVEGYRIVWIWSSQKQEHDRLYRQSCIERATHNLEAVRTRLLSPRSRLKTRTSLEAAATAAVTAANAERWVKVEVHVMQEHQYEQAKPGRPSAATPYLRRTKQKLEVHWYPKPDNLQYDDRTDGIFPLITNDNDLPIGAVLDAYKHQPSLEKRHEQLKTTLDVMPVFLKSEMRVEALLFVYFLALLVEALIEREVRRQMKSENIAALPLYPEDRPCKAPTTDQIFRIFEDQRCHTLLGPGNVARKRFHDPLTPLHKKILQLLGLSAASYHAAGEGLAPQGAGG
jgi:transposase